MIVKRKMRKIEGFWFFFYEFPRKNTGASPCERSRSQRRCSHSAGVRPGVFQQALASGCVTPSLKDGWDNYMPFLRTHSQGADANHYLPIFLRVQRMRNYAQARAWRLLHILLVWDRLVSVTPVRNFKMSHAPCWCP